MEVLWVFLPVLGALLAHAPVLRFGWLGGLKRPLDGGATFRGRRILGDNKTYRGVLVMFLGACVAAVALMHVPAYRARVPSEIRAAGPWTFGVLLGLGTVLAELPNSFLKRQLDIAPGQQQTSLLGMAVSLFDQGDFVFGIWLALAPVWCMTATQALTAFLLVALIHSGINVIGYAIGARTNWR